MIFRPRRGMDDFHAVHLICKYIFLSSSSRSNTSAIYGEVVRVKLSLEEPRFYEYRAKIKPTVEGAKGMKALMLAA